ncbi:hypothetical protein BLS_002397 [Venturia inaequalis]|uniref:Fe2OG dioxygenase domain-containing protein n=2 Tax=Venturia inaequalis TaxID=5025 RepID=A0A8H3Z0S3_VENIN|nr:hypothetical protein BLS_002397 [Venturia inaequalis]
MEFVSYDGNRRTIISNTARQALPNEILTISFKSSKQRLLSQLHEACTGMGLFYLQDHNIPISTIEEAFEMSRRFFDQEAGLKQASHHEKFGNVLRGYEDATEVVTIETGGEGVNEAFNWGYEKGMDLLYPKEEEDTTQRGESQDSPMEEGNVWPSTPSGFRNILEEYYTAHLTLCRHLSTLFAETLNLPPETFTPFFSKPGATARLVHYPPQSSHPPSYGLAAHTDIECFTIVAQDSIPGLQVLNTVGEWLHVPPIPGTLVVNIGDMFGRMTNDLFTSAVHRVWNISGVERYAGVFFFGVDFGSDLETLEVCLNGELKYEPVVAGEYVLERLTRNRQPLGNEA